MRKKWGSLADWMFGAVLCAAVLLYLSRINMGMADLDESFYLTIPYRLTQGDALLADEWHVSQLAGFLIYPWMKLYLALTGTTEGIVLAFRYIYLFVQVSVTIVGYLLLRNRDKWLAAAVSMIYMLFTPFGIKALSYNTMGLMAVYLFVVLGLVKVRRRRLKYVIMGLMLAAAVLCNPYMILLYVILVLLTVIGRVVGTGKGHRKGQQLLFITLGAGILFVMFMIFELSRVSLGQILDSLQFVVADSAHQSKSLGSVIGVFVCYIERYPVYFAVWTGCVLAGVIGRKVSGVMFSVISVASVGLVLYFALSLTNGIGYAAIMIPLSFLGLAAFLFTRKKSRELFWGWLVGLFYGFCMGASSNNGIYTFANACTVSSCVSVLMIGAYVRERHFSKNAGSYVPVAVFAAVLCVQLFAEGYVLMNHIFWESGPESLTAKVESGPLAGLYTTRVKSARYAKNYENVLELKELDGENVIFYCRFPCGYLIMDDWNNGGCSAWLADSVENLADERMEEYGLRHPQKQADVIYVDDQSTDVWTADQWEAFCVENGYRLEQFENGGYVLIRE